MTTHPRRCLASILAAAAFCGAPLHAQGQHDLSQPAAVPPRLEVGPATAAALERWGSPSRQPPTDQAVQHSVWRELFSDTWRDAKRLPSRETLGWLTLGTAAAIGTRPADTQVGHSLAKATQLTEPLEPGAVVGSTPLQLGASAATYAIGRATNSPRMIASGADLFRAQLIAQGLTMAMKTSVRRQRPEGSGFAFPSGHTTVSFSSATVLQQHFGWRVGLPAYAVASYVALSRVQMKRHYLSDVAFGAALGMAIGRTATIGRRVEVAPMATAGGAGVQFTWVGSGFTSAAPIPAVPR